MKRQVRPFIVEVKQKRGIQKRARSIWGDVDLSAAREDVARNTDPESSSNKLVIDTGARPVDGVDGHDRQAERYMPDPQETETQQIVTEAPAPPKEPEPAKKVSRARKTKAEPKQPAPKSPRKSATKSAANATAPARTPRKSYSGKERTQKLAQIEKAIAGGSSIKSAVAGAGISEQTYYLWKKAAAPARDSGDLKDLVALEEENTRLKGLLAERLRKENAELKKRLGLD